MIGVCAGAVSASSASARRVPLARAEVVDFAGGSALGEQAIAADDVADVGEVADDVEVAGLDAELVTGLDLGHLPRQCAEDVRRRLPRAGVVERSDHHDVGAVRQEVLDAQQVGRGLCSRSTGCSAAAGSLP